MPRGLLGSFLFAVAAIANIVGCGGSGTADARDASGDDATNDDSGIGPQPPCNLGCANFPGNVTIHVDDPAGSPVPSPIFSKNGVLLSPRCVSLVDGAVLGAPPEGGNGGDAGGIDGCTGWIFANQDANGFPYGMNTVQIAAPGYATQTTLVDVPYGVGCTCGGPPVDVSVTLEPSDAAAAAAIDAGDGGTADGASCPGSCQMDRDCNSCPTGTFGGWSCSGGVCRFMG